ncbi:MAG: CotH kinase family protein [Steroidobacteraceae bacterium]
MSTSGAAVLPRGAGPVAAVQPQAERGPQARHAEAAASDPRSATSDRFFRAARVYTFELTIDPADFARMPPKNGGGGRGMGGFGGAAAGGSGYAKVPARLRFDGREWGAVAIRYKGNSSYRGARSDLKRSIKLDFNVHGQRRRFFGMSKLNLNNNAFDSSQMRETLAYQVFRRAGVPAPRTAYARVFITVPGRYQRKYVGLFTVVEQIDQTFFVERWRHKVGLLLKPEGLSGLPDLGKDWSSYAQSYASKITAKPADAQRFIAFVEFIDHSSDQKFARHIGDYLDVDEFLRFLAVEVVTVNSDSPLAMNHNYYLTLQPGTGKVEWLPWDMNMAFGGFRRGEVNLSLYHASAPGMFPLADRVLSVPALLERYRRIVREIIEHNLSRTRMDMQVQHVAALIQAAVALDPTTSAAQLQLNLSENPPAAHPAGADNGGGFGFHDHDGPPLRHFIDDRIDSVRDQLDGKSVGVAGHAGFGSGPGPA